MCGGGPVSTVHRVRQVRSPKVGEGDPVHTPNIGASYLYFLGSESN